MPAERIFAVRRARLTRALLAAAATLALTGCPTQSVIRGIPGVSNGQPATVGNPVHITLDWSGVPYHDLDGHVSIDGTAADSIFGIRGSCCTGQATLFLAPGSHQVNFSVGRGSMGPYQEYLPFIVSGTGITLTPTPASVTLAPGATATVSVAATAPSAFTGSIAPSGVTGLPAGVTATTTSTGSMSFTIALAAAAGAANGTSTATISATTVAGSCGNCLAPLTPTAPLGVTVSGPGFTITGTTPTSLLVPRAGSQSVSFTVARAGGFTGPIMITAAGLTGGVTAPATTIAAGSNTGSITFNAKDSTGLAAIAAGSVPPTQTATVTLTCVGTCTGTPPTRNITVRIGHRLGVFVVAPPSAKNAITNANAADNTATLQYATKNPPDPTQTLFTATYRRANTGTTQLAAIDVAQSPIDWGAGFCTATPTVAGVVLSRPYGGQTNAQLFYELAIWAPPPSTSPARQIFQPVYTSMGTVNLSVTPQLWYSPDCTIAAYPSATGVQAQPSALTIIDMRTGNPISGQMSFSGAFPSKLEVVGNAATDSVKVTFSPTDVRKVLIP